MVRAILVITSLALFLAAPLRAQMPKPAAGERYAFVVSVRDYTKAKLGKLPYTENDIAKLVETLVAAGYKPANIVQLGRAAGEKDARWLPLAANVRKELAVLLGSLEEKDSILVALAGHGVQFRGQSENYYCPMDAELDKVETLLSLTGLYAQLKSCKARQKVLLVDACRDDPRIAGSRGPKGVELEPVGKPQEIEPPKGIAALFSCSPGQKAWEDNNLQHGVFFHFVIEGLKGAADSSGEGDVAYDELVTYATKQVKDYARIKLGELQIPRSRADVDGQFIIVRRVVPLLAVAPFDAAAAKKHQQAWASYLRVETMKTNSVNMNLVLIPPGEFLMGSPLDEENRKEDETLHRVRITRPYYLGQTEVTIRQFRDFVTSETYKTEAEKDGRGIGFNVSTDEIEIRDKKYTWRNSGWAVTDEHPVVNVTWNDAQAFCAWLSRKEGKRYRLPTEAEWEYACRAGTTTAYFHGNNQEGLVQVGNVLDATAKVKLVNDQTYHYLAARDGYVFTAPVAQFRANGFGLHDMHGNVEELCGDWYGAKYYDALAGRTTDDPAGDASDGRYRVWRGGSWLSQGVDARAASRDSPRPDERSDRSGFRVVLDTRTP